MIRKIQKLYDARDLEGLLQLAKPTERKYNRKNDFRSSLMLSCNNLKHLSKIESLLAESIILNLEDGVSKEEKPFALVLSALFLSQIKKSEKKLVVRVNALDEGGAEEIEYLNAFMPDAIRVPKIRTKEDVSYALELVDRDIELHLSIETAEAWNNLQSLKVSERVTVFYLGVLDLLADMKLSHRLIEPANPTMHYILTHFLVTTKAMKVKPVSFVFQEYKDLDTFRKWLEFEEIVGYDAKGSISPKQVELIHEIFTNKEEERRRAKKIVTLFQEHRENGVTGFVDDEYGFIDEPIYKGALNILKKEEG